MRKSHLIKVYREAARMVAEAISYPSCNAVCRAGDSIIPLRLYEKTMGSWDLETLPWEQNKQMIRVLLLLLMAEYIRTDYEETK